jgi:HTH-type transcriptional regulator/antitoxin HigA
VRTEADYDKAIAYINELLDEVGDDEAHPLAEVLDLIATQVKAYEDEHVEIPDAEPREVLRFLMEQQNLTQADLDDCAPQNRISEILSGKRVISKDVAKRLAKRFHVHADIFL